jgi:hypothetical protein
MTEDDDKTYVIFRVYHPSQNKDRETIKEGCTREEAIEHCSDPDTCVPGEYSDHWNEE